MYIQRTKKGAYYLKKSEWSQEKQSSTTTATYLGSSLEAATAKLKTEVQPYEYLDLRDKLLKASIRKPSEILSDLQNQFALTETLLIELEPTSTLETLKIIDKIRKHHAELIKFHTVNTPISDENQVELF